ncbi:MAG: FTR1 family protein [Gammaproteobacteria bacterium]
MRSHRGSYGVATGLRSLLLSLVYAVLLVTPCHGAEPPGSADADARLWSLIDDRLAAATEAYHAGRKTEAYKLAVSAYLDGFELVETRLDLVDHRLMKSIEAAMAELRQSIRTDAAPGTVERQYASVRVLLDRAQEKLQRGAGLAPALAAASSGAILLREGTEAVLVIAALIAFLRKTGREGAAAYIHAGWISAVLLGIATWWLASAVLEVSGAGREATEGVVALLAAAMLIYVGYWLHDNMHAKRWKVFLHDKVGGALSAGQVWLLALISFTAAYREVFETVLFYQALALEAGPGSGFYLAAGGAAGLVLLALVALLILHFSVRLPLRLFFGVNALILVVLSLVIAGKGIAALQEAGYVPVDHLSFPEWNAVGLYANWEALGVQAFMLILVIVLLRLSHHRRQHGIPS